MIYLFLCFMFEALPNLNETSQEAIVVLVGEDAFIDCKVENQQNYTVLFKYIRPDQDLQNGEVISAGNIRVIGDTRFSVLHHSGKYKLQIQLIPKTVKMTNSS